MFNKNFWIATASLGAMLAAMLLLLKQAGVLTIPWIWCFSPIVGLPLLAALGMIVLVFAWSKFMGGRM